MIKTKSALLYIVVTFMVIMLFSSFEAEQYFDYSSKLDLSDEMMYRAMTHNFEGIFIEDDIDPVIPAEDKTEFEIDDVSSKIEPYTFKLYYLDYITEYPKTPDTFDEVLYDAVFKYQETKGLEQNGKLDKITTDALSIEAVEYKRGKIGNEILQFQLTLSNLGYIQADTEMNGTFGEETEAAVRAYQQANGLIVTGTITAETQLALAKPLDEQVKYDPEAATQSEGN